MSTNALTLGWLVVMCRNVPELELKTGHSGARLARLEVCMKGREVGEREG